VQLIIENEENIVQDVIANEQTWWSEAKVEYPFLQSDSFLEYPETVVAFRHILKIIDRTTSNELPASEIAKVRDKCGIPRTALEKILEHFERTVNWNEMDEVHERMSAHVRKLARQPTSTEQILLDVGITSDDSLKHNYVRRNDNDATNPYTFPAVKSRLLAIVDGEKILSVDAERDRLPDSLKKISRVNVCIDDREFGFVFDQTNFTSEGGNRYHDSGCIVFDNKHTFKVNRVRKIQNLVVHYVVLLSK
jgi:alanyl-tRNA synthetase